MTSRQWPPPLLHLRDKLIDTGQPDFQMNACIGRQLPSDRATHYYSEGFRLAARHMAVNIVEADNSLELPIDVVVYPVIFLYRHHFELQLKLIIRASRAYLREPGVLPNTHRLDTLWGIARPLVEKALKELDWGQNRHVTRLLTELSSIDPNGEAARYDKSHNGEKHFKDLWIINIRHFAEVSERLGDYLEHILDAIEITHQQRCEWEYDALSYYDTH